MDWGIVAIVFVFGLIIGSFLNSVIYRLDDIKTIFTHRSHCPHCKAEIAWYDLIPFFSFVALSGKCRACRRQISWQYPLVEIATAILFGLIYWYFGLSVYAILLMLISCFLMVIFVYDWYHMLIPDIVLIPGIVVWAIFWLCLLIPGVNLGATTTFSNLAIGALVAGGFIALLVVATKGKGMGIGDIKLALLLGFVLGWPNVIVGLSVAFILGAIVGIIFIIAKTKKLKSAIAFGPFLIIGFYVALFWGQEIIKWYLR